MCDFRMVCEFRPSMVAVVRMKKKTYAFRYAILYAFDSSYWITVTEWTKKWHIFCSWLPYIWPMHLTHIHCRDVDMTNENDFFLSEY